MTVHYPSPLEQALRGKLDQLVAAGRLAEAGAAAILPGYEYPELLTWVHDPVDQFQPPDLDAVLALGEQFRTEQAQQATGDTQGYYLDTADDSAAEDADADGFGAG